MSKKDDRDFNACDSRWKRSAKEGEWGEVHQATNDCEKIIEREKEQLKNMNPNSKEYSELSDQINKHEDRVWNMKNEQRLNYNTSKMESDLDKYKKQNEEYGRKMDDAIKKGDTRAYDENRARYEKNVSAQESMEKSMKMNGQNVESTAVQQRRDLLNRDIDMRDKASQRIAEAREKGKQPKQADLDAQKKYAQNVKSGEVDVVKKQNQQKIENMEKRNEDPKKIEAAKEQNAKDEKWVQGINR